MGVRTEVLKKWCDTNISAMAWQRLGLELFDELDALNINFDQLEEPSKTDELSDEAFVIFKSKIEEIYQVSLEESVLQD